MSYVLEAPDGAEVRIYADADGGTLVVTDLRHLVRQPALSAPGTHTPWDYAAAAWDGFAAP